MVFASATALSRSTGSAIWVCSVTSIPETWLRAVRSDCPCTETGTMATSEDAGNSPRLEQELAHHPAHQCHHHVVDLDPEVVLDPLDVVEVEPGEGDIAAAR